LANGSVVSEVPILRSDVAWLNSGGGGGIAVPTQPPPPPVDLIRPHTPNSTLIQKRFVDYCSRQF